MAGGPPLTREEGLRRLANLRAARASEGPSENRAAAELLDFIGTANFYGYVVSITGEFKRAQYDIGCCGSLVRTGDRGPRWTSIAYCAHPDGPIYPHVCVDLSLATDLILLGPF